MILKWLFPAPTAKGDTSPLAEEPASAAIVALPTSHEILTETAAIVIYDLHALAHRRNDDVDWWADPELELEELRNRNLLVLGVQADGFYEVEVTAGEIDSAHNFSLWVPSGILFVGPGEEITGGGSQPTGQHGGFFVSIAPGDYTVSVIRVDESVISLGLISADSFENSATEPIRI